MELRIIALFAGLVPILSLLGLDTAVAERLYSPGAGWVYGNELPWRLLYEYGVIPAYAIAMLCLMLLLAGGVAPNMAWFRRFSLYCLLVLLIGPGLIVNALLKDNWGRPRPRQVYRFGGTMPYLYVWEKGYPHTGKSFPCGHASAGFFLFVPYFALRRRKRRLAHAFLILGFGYGSFMGIARMTQGGHFLSDVIGSGVIVYAVGLSLAHLFGFCRGAVRDSDQCDGMLGLPAREA